MKVSKNTIYEWFRKKKKPTAEQFKAVWDSFWHKNEKIPIENIDELPEILQTIAQGKVKEDFHTVDEDVLDWSYIGGMLNSNTQRSLEFKNLRVGTFFLKVEGDADLILPEGFSYVGGEKGDYFSYYQIICLDSRRKEGIYSIYKEVLQ